MNDEDKRANRRVPVALRIRLRYQAVDQFISKFAVNISRGGMFLSSRNPKPVGTKLQFEMRLADDSPVIEGTGEVRWIREYDRRRPNDPYGMGIRFIDLSPDSRKLIERILEFRRGGTDTEDAEGIPEPRYVGPDGSDSTASASLVIPVRPGPPARAHESDAVPEPIGSEPSAPPEVVSSPLARQDLSTPVFHPPPSADDLPRIDDPVGIHDEPTAFRQAPQVQAPPPAIPTPAATAPEPPAPPPPPPSPPRAKGQGPKGQPSTPLPPPPRRRSAKSTNDLVGYLGAEPPAVRAAVERARSLARGLAGSDLDRELVQLLDDAEAAPDAITVDHASHELARRLGGQAVPPRRMRGQDTPEQQAGLEETTGGSIPIDTDDIVEEADSGDRPRRRRPSRVRGG